MAILKHTKEKELTLMTNSVKKIIIGGACSAIAIAALSVGGVSAYKKSAEKNSIGTDAAYSLAVEDAGINKENARKIRNDFEHEDGRFVYEVEFDADGKEYDYIIDAKSGEIIEKESENEVPVTSQTTSSETTAASAEDNTTEAKENETKQTENETTGAPVSDPKASTEATSKPAETTTKPADTSISLEKAKSIALSDSGVKASNAKFTKAKLDGDDNCYDIEFVSGNKKYEYEITVKSGKIVDREIENISKKTSTATKSTTKTQTASVSLEKAKSIALSDAGVKASKATFTKAKLDRDDNCYDIEFVSGNKKYEYEVSAKSGRIIDRESESIYTATTDNKQSSSVTLEKAKGIALSNAGVKASKATFTKAKLDRDDNCYDIEFVSGNKKYEYEVSAKSGKIISKETETIRTTSDTSGNKGGISVDEAKKIALNKAGLKNSDVRFIKAKLEKDDGIQVYEIDFISGKYEYEVEINASSGKILDYSREIDD